MDGKYRVLVISLVVVAGVLAAAVATLSYLQAETEKQIERNIVIALANARAATGGWPRNKAELLSVSEFRGLLLDHDRQHPFDLQILQAKGDTAIYELSSLYGQRRVKRLIIPRAKVEQRRETLKSKGYSRHGDP